jgi:hypothetical protein
MVKNVEERELSKSQIVRSVAAIVIEPLSCLKSLQTSSEKGQRKCSAKSGSWWSALAYIGCRWS